MFQGNPVAFKKLIVLQVLRKVGNFFQLYYTKSNECIKAPSLEHRGVLDLKVDLVVWI